MNRHAHYFPISGNKLRMHSNSSDCVVKCSRKEGGDMSIRQKIDAILDKIKSEDKLKRIYEFIKYIHIYTK